MSLMVVRRLLLDPCIQTRRSDQTCNLGLPQSNEDFRPKLLAVSTTQKQMLSSFRMAVAEDTRIRYIKSPVDKSLSDRESIQVRYLKGVGMLGDASFEPDRACPRKLRGFGAEVIPCLSRGEFCSIGTRNCPREDIRTLRDNRKGVSQQVITSYCQSRVSDPMRR